MSPLSLFRRVAIAEAVTWALLLGGMFLKYAGSSVFGDTTEVGVQIAGPIHGVVFVAYCVTTVVVAIDQRWSAGRLALGLLASIPPFVTVLFDTYAEARGALAREWRLADHEPARAVDRPVALLVRRPLTGLGVGLLAVLALTGLALLVGPPA